jgi:hypothetical protein
MKSQFLMPKNNTIKKIILAGLPAGRWGFGSLGLG